jgi:hypothetical protein
MIDNLTKPTRGRLTLWVVLSVVWCWFLVQALAMQPIKDTYVPGAIFWAVVQGGLVWLAWRTRSRIRGCAAGTLPSS